MKKKYILGLTVLSLMALAAGATTVMAASSTSDSNSVFSRGKNGMHQGQNLTDVQKAEMTAKREAVNVALANGDYNAWVKAETALNANCPMLTKITSANFSKYVEAYNLRKQADTIMKNLGFNGENQGIGRGGEGFGFGRGHGGMMNIEK